MVIRAQCSSGTLVGAEELICDVTGQWKNSNGSNLTNPKCQIIGIQKGKLSKKLSMKILAN